LRRDFHLASELVRVRVVAIAVRALCMEHGVDEPTACEVELAVVEAVNNSILHAYAQAAGHSIVVSVELEADRVVVQIRDAGRSMPPGLLASVPDDLEFDPEDLDSLPTGGMGLILMKKVMDDVHYETIGGENVLTLLRLRRAA